MIAETDTLWIVAETDAVKNTTEVSGSRSSHDTGGGFGSNQVIETVKKAIHRQRVPLDAQALKVQMEGMISIVNDLFANATTDKGLHLNEVELSVEINAEGQLSLVGNGGKLGNMGGITLKFIRPNEKNS